jgi:predicted metalloendopeptidase
MVTATATLASFKAFGVKDGDKMYLAPHRRVSIW